MINVTTELNAFHRDGSHDTYYFSDDKNDYRDVVDTRFQLEKNNDIVYISDVTCIEWFRDD